MYYMSLSFFDSMSAETVKQFERGIANEIEYFRSRIMAATEIDAEHKELLQDLFCAVEVSLLKETASLDFLKSNTYSIEDSLSRLKHISRLSVARYENGWECHGVELDDIKSFRKLTERDMTKFFESISRIIKGEPFLYRRQKVFKRELLILVKDVVYDYFMFAADKSHRGLV
jgi:hypothetical protein